MPDGYRDRQLWDAKMGITHWMTRCYGCGLLMIWVPKTPRDAAKEESDG